MLFTRNSKLAEVWKHPVGHDVLQALMHHWVRDENWPNRRVVSQLPLHILDRKAGKGFADTLASFLNQMPNEKPKTHTQAPAWWKETVIYQVYLPSFMDADHDGIGDIAGVTQRLPYLEQLGIGTLLLWRVLDMDKDGGIVNFTNVSSEAGTVEDIRLLAEELHARGMHVLMGVDISYTSTHHPWFVEALKVSNSPYSQYYYLQKSDYNIQPEEKEAELLGCKWRWYTEADTWAMGDASSRAVRLNWTNPSVRKEMREILQFWREVGVDGFYIGDINSAAVRMTKDKLEPANILVALEKSGMLLERDPHYYVEELQEDTEEIQLLMGEMWPTVGTEIAKLFAGEESKQLDLLVDTRHIQGLAGPYGEDSGVSLASLKKYYVKWMQQYGGERWMPLFLETPETSRIVSRLGANPIYRATLAKLLGVMMFTLRGTPMLYQGGELGLANTKFASVDELRSPTDIKSYIEMCKSMEKSLALKKVLRGAADNVRTPMPWSPGPLGGFTGAMPWMRLPDGTDHLNVSTQMQDKNSVWYFYKELIHLRQTTPCLIYGRFHPVFVQNKKVFCYFRICDSGKWYIEMNITEKEVNRPAAILPTQHLVLSNYKTPSRVLRAYEANIYRCD